MRISKFKLKQFVVFTCILLYTNEKSSKKVCIHYYKFLNSIQIVLKHILYHDVIFADNLNKIQAS